MPYFRITLLRSAIGLPYKTRGVLTALGLKKRMRTVFQPISQSVAGQIMKVKELVDVEEVEEKYTQTQIRIARRPDPGFYVEKKYDPNVSFLEGELGLGGLGVAELVTMGAADASTARQEKKTTTSI
jgi:large subunit ribosomal protein L30